MTLDKLRPVVNIVLSPFVRAFDTAGVSPNVISVLAFGCALAAGAAFYLGGVGRWWYVVGAVLVFLNGWLDLIDGALARRQEIASPAGDVIDHVLDRYADIVIIAGLAAGTDAFLLGFAAITGVLMTSYLGTQTIAVGLERAYGGVVGRADRLAIIGVVAVVYVFVPEPLWGVSLIGWLLVFLAVVGHVTALQRFVGALGRLD